MEIPCLRARDFRTISVQRASLHGAGPKKVGGPAPQIGLLCNTVAQVPAEKTDLRHYHSRDGIVRGPSVLSRRKKRQRSSKTPSDGIVRGPSVLSRRGKGQRSRKKPRDGIVRGPSVLSRRGKGQRSSRMPGDGIVGGPSVPSRRGKRGDLQQYGILYIFVG